MAQNEQVTFIIDAEDRATAKLRKSAEAIKQTAENVQEVGGKAKASTELVGALTASLGGSRFGQAASEVAMLTERLSAFASVARQGAAASVALRLGIVGVALVAVYSLGKALYDLTIDHEAAAEAARYHESELRLLQDRMRDQGQTAISNKIDLARFAQDEEKALARLQRQLEFELEIRSARAKHDPKGSFADQDKSMIPVLEKNIALIEKRIGKHAQLVKKLQEQKDAQAEFARETERKAETTRSLEDQIRLLESEGKKRNEIQADIMVRKKQIDALDREAVVQMLNRIDAIKEKREQERKDLAEYQALRQKEAADQKAERQKILDLQLSTLRTAELEALALAKGAAAVRQRRLEQQGLSREQAENIARMQDQLANLQRKASVAPELTGEEDRVSSGRALGARNDQMLNLAQENRLQQDKANSLLEQIRLELSRLNAKPQLQVQEF